jgi:hypothetical protein
MSLTCVGCDRPFPLNRELASIPQARTVAFDPAHRRVWRICSECGAWNLLGLEHAAIALPELEARHAASMKQPARSEMTPARISAELQLIRLGPLSDETLRDNPLLRRKAQIDRQDRRTQYFGVLVGLVVAGWAAFVAVVSHGDVRVPIDLLLMYSLVILGTLVMRRLRGYAATTRSLLLCLGVVVVAAGLQLALTSLENLKIELVGFGCALPFLVASSWLEPKLRVFPPHSAEVKLSERQLAEVTVGWNTRSSELSVFDLPKGRWLHGEDAAVAFRGMLDWVVKRNVLGRRRGGKHLTANAWNLLRAVGGLPGLLHALDGFRDDQNGRLFLSDLPPVYLVALDLGLGSDEGPETELPPEVTNGAVDARALAAGAEHLDDELRR